MKITAFEEVLRSSKVATHETDFQNAKKQKVEDNQIEILVWQVEHHDNDRNGTGNNNSMHNTRDN